MFRRTAGDQNIKLSITIDTQKTPHPKKGRRGETKGVREG